METLLKILRWVFYLVPLCLCALAIFMCVASMIDYQKLNARMEKKIEKRGEQMDEMSDDADVNPLAVILFLPMMLSLIFAESIGDAIGMAMCSAIFILGGATFLAGLVVALCSRKAPLELRRAGILLNGLLLVLASAIYVCGYFA